MKIISLFAGIGGFDLAAEKLGWETIAWSEWNEFGKIIMSHYWPKAKKHGDITKTDFNVYRGKCDIITGGFPCQPFSLAGERKGTEDDRHLWPEMLRAVREAQPRWVVGENVFGIVNWSGGLVFEQVQADLEAKGYEVQPYVLPAAGVNAPHRRDRTWFVAYHTDTGIESVRQQEVYINGFEPVANASSKRYESTRNTRKWRARFKNNHFAITSNTKRERMEGGRPNRQQKPSAQIREGLFGRNITGNYWEFFPTQSPVCDGNDGIPSGLVRDRIRADSMGLLSEKEIDIIVQKATSKLRNESIKAGGNAIVHQVALQIFKAINEYEKEI